MRRTPVEFRSHFLIFDDKTHLCSCSEGSLVAPRGRADRIGLHCDNDVGDARRIVEGVFTYQGSRSL